MNSENKNTTQLQKEIMFSEQVLNYYFEQSIDGVFLMMIDEPIVWNDTVDKEAVLDYVFEHHRVTKVNDVMLSQYGSTFEEFIGLRPKDFYAHNIQQGRISWGKFFDEGKISTITNEKKLDGSDMIIKGEYYCIYDEQNRITGHFGIQKEIDYERDEGKRISVNESNYRYIENNTTDIFFQLDLQGHFTFVSQSLEKLLGYSPIEVIGQHVSNFIHSEDYSLLNSILQDLLIGIENNTTLIYRIKHKNGDWLWHRGNAKPVFNSQNELLYINGNCHDFTDIKNKEIEVSDKREKYRLIAENTSDGILISDAEGIITYRSPGYTKQLGYSLDEEIGHTTQQAFNLLHPEDREIALDTINKSIASKEKTAHYTFRVKHKEGHYIWREDSVNFIYDSNGNYNGAYIICRDITQRLKIENELKENEKKYRFIVENIYDIIFQIDLVGILTFVSNSYTKLMGYELSEVLGKSFIDIIHIDDIQRINDLIHYSIINKTTAVDVVYRVHHKDGSLRWHETNAIPIVGEDGNVMYAIGVARDITKAKESEEEIKRHCANLLAVIENIDDIICLRDLEHKVIVFNEKFNAICKTLFNTEAKLGMNTLDLLAIEEQNYWRPLLEKVIKGERYKDEFVWDFGDNDIKYYEISYNPIVKDKQIIGYTEITKDITIHKLNEIKLKEQNQILIDFADKLHRKNLILDIINNLQSSILKDKVVDTIFTDSLNKFLELTESEFGFIGEVFDTDTNKPYLKTNAITDISWDLNTKKFFEENVPEGLIFKNLDTLFGEVLVTKVPLIANDPANHPKKGGLPKGHPPLKSFLGLPLIVSNKMVGMIGIANKPDGYTNELITELEPLTKTIARLIDSQSSKLALKKNEEKISSIIDSMDDIIFVLDKDLNYLEVHHSHPNDLIIQPEFFIGKHFDEVGFPEPAGSKIKQSLLSCLKENTTQHIDYYLDINSNIEWFDLKVTNLKNPYGVIEGLVCVVRNITDNKRKEEELVYISTQLQGINNALNSSAIVSITDLKGRIVKINDKFCDVSGYLPHELLGKNNKIVNSGIHNKLFWKELWDTLQSGKTWRGEVCNRHKNGELYWVDAVINPILDENGFISQYLSINNLITEKKIAEEENKRLSFIAQKTHTGIIITDKNGITTWVNQAMIDISGYTFEELLGKKPGEILQGKDTNKEHIIKIRQGLDSLKPFTQEILNYSKNGDSYWLSLNINPVFDNNGELIQFIAIETDITERKIAEEELRKSEENFRTLFDIMPVGISIYDKNGNLLAANKYSEVITGISREDLKIKEIVDANWTTIRTDGTIMPEEEWASLRAANEGKEIYGVEMGLKRANGDIDWLIANASPIPEDRIVISYQDITELKKYQIDLKETIIRLEERNDSLQNFAHIVSHNLRSHSANISGLLSLILLDNPDLNENTYFVYLNKANDNLMNSITHLSEVAQLTTNEKLLLYNINIAEIIQSAITNVFALAIGSNVEIINECKTEFKILGNQSYLDSIILNFLTNSIKYRSELRKSFVKLSNYIEKNYLVVEIEDNGLGIDLEKHGTKLFGLFKTFHNHPEARGVGLFISNNQVKALGGRIEVESKVEIGTKFKIYFKLGNENE